MSTKTKRGRPGQRRKGIEQVIQFALGHKLRLQILILLNEGAYTCTQIAEIIDEPRNNVANHVKELLDGGSIEVAKEEKRGNITMNLYRAAEIPCYSKEEAESLTHQERQVTAGLIVQGASAEVMAALWAGKLADPRTVLSWDWHHVDEKGREDSEAEMKRHLDRMTEIEVESTNRVAESGEATTAMLHTLFGYERARQAPKFTSSEDRDRD